MNGLANISDSKLLQLRRHLTHAAEQLQLIQARHIAFDFHMRDFTNDKESTGQLRCFGSTLKGLDSKGILKEYGSRWTIENGIKDLIENYYLNKEACHGLPFLGGLRLRFEIAPPRQKNLQNQFNRGPVEF